MFKPNGNQDRRNYSELLMPPIGYTLEKAVGTTYSLDLESLTAVCICLGLSEETDSKLVNNPIGMLNALQKVSDRIVIFCEAGQIKSPSKPSSLSILLERMVVPVALPLDKKMGRYPAFHPKTWVLSYVNDKGDRLYRFVVLSRNLTFDRSWDISFAMDGRQSSEKDNRTKPLVDFLGFLRKQVHNTFQFASDKRNLIGNLQKELENVSFTLNSKEFDERFEILPLGIGEGAFDMTQDYLFCTDKGSADSTFHELVIMSPFLSAGVIEDFNITGRGLTDCKRTLITRRSELGKLKPHQVDNFDIYTLKDDIVDGEQYLSDDTPIKSSQDIHAKIYLRRKYADVDLYLGSMNASYSAINKNVEMMIWIGTRKKYLSGESFLKDVFCGEPDGKNNPFEKVTVEDCAAEPANDVGKALERKIKDLCRVPKMAVVTPDGEKYRITIRMEGVLEDETIKIAPFNSKQQKPIASEIVFTDMEILQLSEFYVVTAECGEEEISRILMIPTTGFPKEREKAVVNSVVKDRRTFVEYIAFVLGDDSLLSVLEEKQIGESGLFGRNSNVMPAVYEKMLKTSLEAPERLKDISYVLRMITDKEIIPDEFRDTYDTFCRALKIR